MGVVISRQRPILYATLMRRQRWDEVLEEVLSGFTDRPVRKQEVIRRRRYAALLRSWRCARHAGRVCDGGYVVLGDGGLKERRKRVGAEKERSVISKVKWSYC